MNELGLGIGLVFDVNYLIYCINDEIEISAEFGIG